VKTPNDISTANEGWLGQAIPAQAVHAAEDASADDTLRLDLTQARANAVRADERARAAESQVTALEAVLVQYRAESQRLSADSAEQTEADRQQRAKLHAELLTERERAGRLDAQLQNLYKEATDALSRLKSQFDRLQRDHELLAAQKNDMEAKLQQATESAATWERVGAESMSIVARARTLQDENAALRAEVKRLRPPSAEADPLTLVMIDRVKALHWLAVYESRLGRTVTGQPLATYDAEQILTTAQYQAFAARRDFYFHTRWPHEPRPVWMHEDYLLDDTTTTCFSVALSRCAEQLASCHEDHHPAPT
jgi:hypothetical protein